MKATTTQKALKQAVSIGIAKNITDWSYEKLYSLKRSGVKTIAISTGIYGINAALFQDDHGKLYAITARAIALDIMLYGW